MTARRAFMTLPKYEGKAETYDAWKFQAGQFLGEEVYFTEFLQYLEGLAADPDEHDLADFATANPNIPVEKVGWMSHQMYQVLSLNCIGDALSHIKGLQPDTKLRGARAWWRLTQEWQSMSGQRLQGLVGRVYSPEKTKNYRDVMVALEKWEQ